MANEKKVEKVEKDALLRKGKEITYKGRKVATEDVEGTFVYEGYVCAVTGQDASGYITYKKVAKVTTDTKE